MGNGDGTFQAAVNYPVGVDPRHVLIYDFNKDGKMDLISTNGGGEFHQRPLRHRRRHIPAAGTYTANASPRWLAVADYNNDGFLDVATSNYDGGNISILLGTGSSVSGQAFLAHQDIAVGKNPTGLAAGDFNGDGLPDIAVPIGGTPTVPNTLMAVLLNNPVTVSPASLTFPTQVLGTTSAPQTVTLTNGAPNSLTIPGINIGGTNMNDFSIPTASNTCGTALAGNASCTVGVVFNPTSVNNRTATLIFTDAGTQTVALNGVATAVMLSPPSLTFANQVLGNHQPIADDYAAAPVHPQHPARGPARSTPATPPVHRQHPAGDLGARPARAVRAGRRGLGRRLERRLPARRPGYVGGRRRRGAGRLLGHDGGGPGGGRPTGRAVRPGAAGPGERPGRRIGPGGRPADRDAGRGHRRLRPARAGPGRRLPADRHGRGAPGPRTGRAQHRPDRGGLVHRPAQRPGRDRRDRLRRGPAGRAPGPSRPGPPGRRGRRRDEARPRRETRALPRSGSAQAGIW